MARRLYQAALDIEHLPSSIDAKITPFDGDSDSLEFFIKEIRELATIKRWSDPEILFYAKRSLVGPAYKFLTNISSYTDITTSNQLFSALRTHFPYKDPHQARQELSNFKRHPEESIRHMAQRLDALTHKAYPNSSEETRNTIKQEKFLINIPYPIRVQILQSGIESYLESVEKAVHLSNCDLTSQIIANSSNSPLRNISEEIKSLKETINNLKHNQQPSSNFQKGRFYRKKYAPHRDNNFRSHTFSKYKFRSKYNNTNNNRYKYQNPSASYVPTASSSSQNDFQNVVCQCCFQTGHTVRFCPTFKSKFIPLQSNTSIPLNIPSVGRSNNINHHQDVINSQSTNIIHSSVTPDLPVNREHPNWSIG